MASQADVAAVAPNVPAMSASRTNPRAGCVRFQGLGCDQWCLCHYVFVLSLVTSVRGEHPVMATTLRNLVD